MTAPSTGTQPIQRTVADWVHIMHNAALVQPDSPNYGLARNVLRAAKSKLDDAVSSANQADQPPDPNALMSAIVNFGQGGTAGLSQTTALRQVVSVGVPGGEALMSLLGSTPEQFQDYLWQARAAHPVASGVGNVAGMIGGGLVAGEAGAAASLMRMGPFLGGAVATGVPIGVQTGIETGSAGEGVVAGLIGGAVGGLGSKALSKLPLVRNITTRIMARLSGQVPEGASIDAAESAIRQELKKTGLTSREINTIVKEERLRLGRRAIRGSGVGPGGASANDLEEAQIRSYLDSQGFSEDHINQLVRDWRAGGAKPAGGAAAPKGKPGQMSALPETQGRGFEVTGERATPNIPASAPTIGEMSGMANLQIPRVAADAVKAEAFERAAAEVPAIQPKPPALSANARPQEVPLVSQYRSTIKQIEEHLGRELTGEERRVIAARFSTPHPGHPLWFGPGAPTE